MGVPFIRITLSVSLATTMLVQPHRCNAQSANDNAVLEAEDAFGFNVGSEAVGLYSSASVRGFSPVAANNVRVQGLYFDQQGYLGYNAFDSSSVEVGLNARDYTLTSPSGVVDYTLRQPGSKQAASITGGIDPISSPYLSSTFSLISGKGSPALTGRLAYYPGGRNAQGARNQSISGGAAVFIPISNSINLTGFLERDDYEEASSPTYFTAGATVLPRVSRGVFAGQSWATYKYDSSNSGIILDWAVSRAEQVRLGIFRSTYDLTNGAYDLISRIDAAGNGRRSIYLYPPAEDRSISGEMQYRRIVETGHLRFTGTASIRGRTVDRWRRDAAVVSLGEVNLNKLEQVNEPEVSYGARTDDDVDQFGLGLHGRFEWNRRLDVSVGVQKTRYEKTVADEMNVAELASSPWLYQVLGAFSLSGSLVLYASASNGLEESGIAPAQAVNRGEVLPAAITTQLEIGGRGTIGPLTVTASGFSLTKPHPNIDDEGSFSFVGTTRHRGVELSLAGQPAKGLNILAGALYLDAELKQRSELGQEQLRAIGQPRYRILLSANYQLPSIKGLSVDGSITAQGGRLAKVSPRLEAPDYALINAGVRYQIRNNLTGRFELRNILNAYGYTISSTSAFAYVPGRTARLALTWTL